MGTDMIKSSSQRLSSGEMAYKLILLIELGALSSRETVDSNVGSTEMW
jgi:hypothetical protein